MSKPSDRLKPHMPTYSHLDGLVIGQGKCPKCGATTYSGQQFRCDRCTVNSDELLMPRKVAVPTPYKCSVCGAHSYNTHEFGCNSLDKGPLPPKKADMTSADHDTLVIDLEGLNIPLETRDLIPYNICVRLQAVAVRQLGNDALLVAMKDPLNQTTIDDLRFLTGLHIVPCQARHPEGVQSRLNTYRGHIQELKHITKEIQTTDPTVQNEDVTPETFAIVGSGEVDDAYDAAYEIANEWMKTVDGHTRYTEDNAGSYGLARFLQARLAYDHAALQYTMSRLPSKTTK